MSLPLVGCHEPTHGQVKSDKHQLTIMRHNDNKGNASTLCPSEGCIPTWQVPKGYPDFSHYICSGI